MHIKIKYVDNEENVGNQGLSVPGKEELLFRAYKISIMQDEQFLEICCTAWDSD